MHVMNLYGKCESVLMCRRLCTPLYDSFPKTRVLIYKGSYMHTYLTYKDFRGKLLVMCALRHDNPPKNFENPQVH